jgi:hypothetical protein
MSDITRRKVLRVVAGTSFVSIGAAASRIAVGASGPSPIADLERAFIDGLAAVKQLRERLGVDRPETDDVSDEAYEAVFENLGAVHWTPPASLADVLTKLRWLAHEEYGVEGGCVGDGRESESLRQCIDWLSGTSAGAST